MENNTNNLTKENLNNNQNQEGSIEIEEAKDWEIISEEFTKELQKEWEEKGFNYEEAKEIISIGVKPNEVNFAMWLRNEGEDNLELIIQKLIHVSEKDLSEIEITREAREVYKEYLRSWGNIERLEKGKFSKIENWKDIHEDFNKFGEFDQMDDNNLWTKTYQQWWEELEISFQEAEELIKLGLKPNHYDWIKQWKDKKMTWWEIKQWIKVGLSIYEPEFTAYLKEKRSITPQIAKNSLTELRKEYYKIQENKLSEEVIEVIKHFPPYYSFDREDKSLDFEKEGRSRKENEKLTSEQKLLVEQLIPNKELKRKYKENGLCRECNQLNAWRNIEFAEYSWCQSCNAQHFRQDFDKWTSGNKEIDRLIQNHQLNAVNHFQLLEWIPYEKFTDIEYLAEGGFSKVYKAEWYGGEIRGWDVKEKKWRKSSDKETYSRSVVLKSLNNSSNVSADFLEEVSHYKLLSGGWKLITKCFGISQDPTTKDYLMVMKYAGGGNLRQCLQDEDSWLREDHFNLYFFLFSIGTGLSNIHEKGLIHRDLHSGNILCSNYDKCYITDLGLSCPANETDKTKIYGVLPYVAPEVLRGQPYTQASDIYSFGIVTYELFSGLPPYTFYDTQEKCYKEMGHNVSLAFAICQGLRPNIKEVTMPQLLKDLVARCWDADPTQRPTAEKLKRVLSDWLGEENKENIEFIQQLKTILEVVEKDKITPVSYQVHPQAIHTSRLLDFKNLPEPQNSKEINEQFYSKSLEVNFMDLNLNDNQTEQEETTAQIQIPSKK